VERRRSALRTAAVWQALQPLLESDGHDGGQQRQLQVIDLGGGTGGFAVRIAELGHRVTVVDPSPDALASLQRRAAEADVTVAAVLADADTLLDVVDAGTADLVLCHGVLEIVDKPARALDQVAAALSSGGTLSLLAAQRSGAVLGRALTGHLAEARALLDDPDGRIGSQEGSSRRFTQAELAALLADAGFIVREVRGVRIFVDHVASTVVDSEPGAADDLLSLEAAVAGRPEFMAMATQLHLLATIR
jgi:S-adenosylmethionine-dependent methyltransferase